MLFSRFYFIGEDIRGYFRTAKREAVRNYNHKMQIYLSHVNSLSDSFLSFIGLLILGIVYISIGAIIANNVDASKKVFDLQNVNNIVWFICIFIMLGVYVIILAFFQLNMKFTRKHKLTYSNDTVNKGLKIVFLCTIFPIMSLENIGLSIIKRSRQEYVILYFMNTCIAGLVSIMFFGVVGVRIAKAVCSLIGIFLNTFLQISITEQIDALFIVIFYVLLFFKTNECFIKLSVYYGVRDSYIDYLKKEYTNCNNKLDTLH